MKAAINTPFDELREASDDPKIKAKANAIDRARAFEESGEATKAIAAYRKVVSRYPDSAAARLCEESIKHLKQEPEDDLSAGSAEAETELRTWTSSNGKFTIRARILGINDNSVELEKSDGKRLTVPRTELSKADNQYIDQWKSD